MADLLAGLVVPSVRVSTEPGQHQNNQDAYEVVSTLSSIGSGGLSLLSAVCELCSPIAEPASMVLSVVAMGADASLWFAGRGDGKDVALDALGMVPGLGVLRADAKITKLAAQYANMDKRTRAARALKGVIQTWTFWKKVAEKGDAASAINDIKDGVVKVIKKFWNPPAPSYPREQNPIPLPLPSPTPAREGLALPSKDRSRPRFSPEYLAVASDRDFWYGLVILSVILSLLVLALAYVFQPAIALELATIPFVIYAITKFAALDQRSGRLLGPWLDENPYGGPGRSILNPLRRLALTHAFPVGITLGVVLTGLVIALAIVVNRH